MKIKVLFFIVILFFLNFLIVFSINDSKPIKFTPSFKWKIPLEDYSSNQISGNIALDKKNNIYITFLGSPGSSSAMLMSFNPNGIKKWSFPLRNFSVSNPVIDEYGNIFVLSSPSLYSITLNGELSWENEEFNNLCNLSLGTNQKLYSYDCSKGTNGRKVWSIGLNGTVDWSLLYENNSKITIDSDNNILLFSIDRLRKENFLIKLDGNTGSLLWKYRVKEDITKTTGIIISPEESIIVNLKPNLVSLTKDGVENWKIKDFYSRNQPIIDTKGIIYSYNETNSMLYAINKDGSFKWKKENGTILPSFITENGIIHYYYADQTNETFLHAVDQDGIDQWTIPLHPNSSAPAVSSDGTIYGFHDEFLVAYQGNSKLASKGCPRSNRNNQNTNCFGTEDEKISIPKKILIEMIVGNSQALVNGFPFKIEPPFLFQNRTYIPFRFLGEFFDADVDFTVNKDSKLVESVSYTTIQKCITLFINQTKGLINGNFILLDSPPLIKNNRTFLPLRFLSEALGANVIWDSKNQTINIQYESK